MANAHDLLMAQRAAMMGGIVGREVAWIAKLHGTAGYLDTGLFGTAKTTIDLTARRHDPLQVQVDLFGSVDDYKDQTHNFNSYIYTDNNNSWYASCQGGPYWRSVQNASGDDEFHVRVGLDDWAIYRNGVKRLSGERDGSVAGQTRWTIKIFTRIYGTSEIYITRGNARIIGHILIGDENGPTREFVPMVRDGVPCYWDAVGQRWYELTNPENFVAGPEI